MLQHQLSKGRQVKMSDIILEIDILENPGAHDRNRETVQEMVGDTRRLRFAIVTKP